MMNSGPQGKARKRVTKKIVFLSILALVALAYVAIPITAFACDGQGNDNGNGNGQKPPAVKAVPTVKPAVKATPTAKPAKGAKPAKDDKSAKPAIGSQEDQQAIADLKAGTKAGEKFFDANNKPVQFAALKVNDKFTIKFGALTLKAQITAEDIATVTLPSGAKVRCQIQQDGTAIVTPISGSIANSVQQTNALLQTNPEVQLFKTDGHPLKLSALQKVGQTFEIALGNNILDAVFLGKGEARVTFPTNGKAAIIELGQLPLAA
jgi:hypothetical protein